MPLTTTSVQIEISFDLWLDRFSRFAEDLYPGRYTRAYVRELVGMAREVCSLAEQKQSVVVAHNYQYPELQEVAEIAGDSLGLSQYVAERQAPRVDFCGVLFMGETAKTILGDRSRVYMPDRPGCSLVASIDQTRIDNWVAHHPDGILISYINTDALTKARSDYICTSRNASQVLAHAARQYPGRRILFLPDKYLGAVVLSQTAVDPALVDLYDGACHVHSKIGETALEEALDRYPDAELLIHPECGCASSCLAKTMQAGPAFGKAYFLSTEQMLWHARRSPSREFIVATEMGMVYRLRKEVPEKTFYPVSYLAVCEYMKMNTLEKLLDSLENDRVEIQVDEEIQRKARAAIQRMLTIT
ncbi:MAG: quinolinate synthase NadA [Acidobacteria bacterium]|nr:quinolinate synthase NadA [Acidobacteriota bacterium]